MKGMFLLSNILFIIVIIGVRREYCLGNGFLGNWVYLLKGVICKIVYFIF